MARTRITHSLLPAATRCCCCCHRLGLPGGGPGGMHPHHPLPAPHHHHLLLLSQAGSSRGWTWRHAPASPSPCSPPPPPAAAVTGWVFQGVDLEACTRITLSLLPTTTTRCCCHRLGFPGGGPGEAHACHLAHLPGVRSLPIQQRPHVHELRRGCKGAAGPPAGRRGLGLMRNAGRTCR